MGFKIIWKEKFPVIILYVAAICYLIFLLQQYDETYFYAEIDSYALPTISIQYRGSLLMNAEDLKIAQADYPNIYKDIDSFEDLRSSQLVVTRQGQWKSYYFPIYAMLCIPAKLILQLLRLDQEWTFGITNVICMAMLFFTLFRSKKLTDIQKAIALLLMIASPSFLYVQYISAEMMIFFFVGIAMLLFYERKYKSAAVFLTLAGMSNCTVMAIGIVFIFDYYVFVFQNNREKSFGKLVKDEFWPSMKLAFCFMPVFVPFIFNFYVGTAVGITESMQSVISNGPLVYLGRVLSYLFDPNLGIASFAPVLEIGCFGRFIYAVAKKQYRAVAFMAAFLGTVIAYGSWWHINCGMLYCARYVYWTYPILVVFMATIGYECRKSSYSYLTVNLLSASVAAALLSYNTNTYYDHTVFNNLTEKILEAAPALYHPLPYTFNSRVTHVDGGYDYETPIVYYNKDRYVKKILAVKEDLPKLQEVCTGPADDRKWLESKVLAITDKQSYISIPGKYKIKYALKYELGDAILFYSNLYNADQYVAAGISGKEDGFTWTDDKEVEIYCNIAEKTEKIHGVINLAGVYGKQNVTILVNDKQVFQEICEKNASIEFDFEKSRETDFVNIKILLPDAVSPASLGKSDDERTLGLAIQSIVLMESGRGKTRGV